jgi:hypothetical protein
MERDCRHRPRLRPSSAIAVRLLYIDCGTISQQNLTRNKHCLSSIAYRLITKTKAAEDESFVIAVNPQRHLRVNAETTALTLRCRVR